jgi:hypothetical protein
MKWWEDLTARLDVTLARAEGSLAVSLGPVVTVYGLDLVEASPAIYVIHPVGVARLDKVVARASVHLVAFAGDDLVVTTAAFDLVVPAASVEAVVPVGPYERIVAAGAG